MFALIDCNNFFVSVERIFRPDLQKVPVIVLSNNDGCVVSRSNEAKELGILMGDPFFKIQKFCKLHNVVAFSSNYPLYADISDRIMQIIHATWDACEIYSIDETFLDLRSLNPKDRFKFCEDLQQKILQYTAIPVSIGIGETKTLAKAANYIGKKRLKIPVFDITPDKDKWLQKIAVNDVWGVGKKWSVKLNALGVKTAYDLAYMNFNLRQHENVIIKRMSLELMGQACLGLMPEQIKQSIVSSRSFGHLQQQKACIEEALSEHCVTAWKKLRSQNLAVNHITVFIHSNKFRQDLQLYSNSVGLKLPFPTDDIRYLITMAKFGLNKIFKKDIYYKKCGVMFGDLTDKSVKQMDIFEVQDTSQVQKSEKFMQVFEDINNKFGSHTIKILAQGFEKDFLVKKDLKSPCYTTRWSELPIVRV